MLKTNSAKRFIFRCAFVHLREGQQTTEIVKPVRHTLGPSHKTKNKRYALANLPA